MSRSASEIDTTPPFNFIYGRYKLSEWEIPYFTTSLTFRDAARSLQLTSEMPGGENVKWTLAELYQRDINWARVEDQIVPYLKNLDRPQFFNSITVALLPLDRNKGEILDSFSETEEWILPNFDSSFSFGKQLDIGPIKFGFWDSWLNVDDPEFQIGKMLWNRDQVFPVAIDGQHRLAAIKDLIEISASDDKVIKSRVPIIFVLFDPRLGFKTPNPDETIVSILRRLFIDLNKHAMTVRRGRQILLDDQDPTARCVRALVANGLEDGLAGLKTIPPYIPLSLTDWHSEQAKFDEGPYVTTILGLDWIVLKALGIKPISDWTDYTGVRNQIDRLQKALQIDLAEASDRLDQAEEVDQTPFTYSNDDLDHIVKAFKSMWVAPIVDVITSLRPYKAVIDRREADDSLSVEFQQWFKLFEERDSGKHSQDSYQSFLRRMRTAPTPRSENHFTENLGKISTIKGHSGNLEYSVIFQKAVFFALIEYVKVTQPDYDAFVFWLNNGDYDDESDTGDPNFDFDLPESAEPDTSSHPVKADLPPNDSWTSALSPAIATSGFDVQAFRYRNRALEFVKYFNVVCDALPSLMGTAVACRPDENNQHYFWLGSLRNSQGTIDFSEGAAKRAGDLIFLIVAVGFYAAHLPAEPEVDFEDIWADLSSNPGPSFLKRTERAIQRLSAESGISGRIAKIQDEEYDEQVAYNEIYVRVAALWNALNP
ncbi:MAG: hypothetical protein C0482_05065 [Gordonia sp.]|nr:hypothetical protein [Gordonia sp. (in: high G+C Gram-positive bacteria)]